jgi:dinuclear metal center YbgI/SA1388 family protein
MPSVALDRLTAYCDQYLRVDEIKDFDGAANGLQVENRGTVTRIVAAVDATLATIRFAVENHADLMVVHHGLFWGPTHPWTGKRYEMLRLLIENNLAVYSVHLPLDSHPVVGNNALLCAALGLKNLKPFFFEREQAIGLRAEQSMAREALEQRLAKAVGGRVTILPGGPDVCRSIGVVTGGAGNQLKTAAREGVDTFITGEGSHKTFAMAEDLGLNVFYAGHYATETFGVKALAAHLSKRFKVPWQFIDHPTGL